MSKNAIKISHFSGPHFTSMSARSEMALYGPKDLCGESNTTSDPDDNIFEDIEQRMVLNF